MKDWPETACFVMRQRNGKFAVLNRSHSSRTGDGPYIPHVKIIASGFGSAHDAEREAIRLDAREQR